MCGILLLSNLQISVYNLNYNLQLLNYDLQLLNYNLQLVNHNLLFSLVPTAHFECKKFETRYTNILCVLESLHNKPVSEFKTSRVKEASAGSSIYRLNCVILTLSALYVAGILQGSMNPLDIYCS